MKTLPNLDFLRSCAVLSVVIEHILLAYGIRQLGYVRVSWIGVVGVFLFFVHTSLVLMWSLERKPHTLDFYIRRIFRIYPLAILAISIAFLFHAPVGGTPANWFVFPPILERKILSVIAAFGLVQNLYHGYTPISVMWSLPYEVEMYVALPVLFFFVSRNFSRWPLFLLWTLSVLVAIPLFRHATHNFFLCIPYFLPGIMAYVGFGRQRARFPFFLFPFFLLAEWFIFLAHPSWRGADLLCLVTGLALPLFHQVRAEWLIKISHNIAKYSYGIYVIHPFSLVLGIYLMPHQPLAVQLAVVLGSLALLSVAAYHFVEYPLIRLGARVAAQAERRYEQHELTRYRIPEESIS